MSINLKPLRYVFESEHCAVVTNDKGAYLLGCFEPQRREWIYLASFDEESSARHAFEVFDRAATFMMRVCVSSRHDLGAAPEWSVRVGSARN